MEVDQVLTNPDGKDRKRALHWLRTGPGIISAVAAVAAVVVVPFAMFGPLPWGGDAMREVPPITSPEAVLGARASQLHKIELVRHPYEQAFLFADYEPPETGSGLYWGRVYIYSGTRESFAKIDEQSCSYPDATEIESDFDNGVLLVSCSFGSIFQREEDRLKKEAASAVTTIRWFNSNRTVNVVLSCSCSAVNVEHASMEPAIRQLKLRVYTRASEIFPEGYPGMAIKLDDVPEQTPIRSFLVQFDEDWSIAGFHLL